MSLFWSVVCAGAFAIAANPFPQSDVPVGSDVESLATASVEGSVADFEGGHALERVSVTLHKLDKPRGFPKRATTDMSGRFAFHSIAPGRYRLWAEREGFVRAEYGARSHGGQGAEFELRDRQRLQNLFIRLLRDSVLTGSVVDAEQRPVADVTVQAVREASRSGRRQLIPSGTGVTDKNGRYQIPGLAPGRYYLFASPVIADSKRVKAAARPGVPASQYLPAYYPGTEDAASAIPVDVAPGTELRDIEITLRLGQTVRIKGKASEALTRRAGPGSVVYLMPADDSERASIAVRTFSINNPQGAFEIDAVRPGAYILMAEHFDGGLRYVAKEHVIVGRSDLEIELATKQAPPVFGRIRVEPEGASVQLETITVELHSSGPSPLRVLSGKVRKDGTFTIEQVAPGPASVQVSGIPDRFHVKEVRQGQTESKDFSIHIPDGATIPLEITLSASGGRVSGSVLNSSKQPVPDAIVVLAPDEPRRGQIHLYRTVKADARGSFEIFGIAPGGYSLLAVEGAEELPYYDPAFLKRAERSLAHISMPAGHSETVQLRLARFD